MKYSPKANMSDFSNEINTEIAAASWEQSPDASSSAPTSNSAGRQPQEIHTRISTSLVSWYALCRIGYEFLQEGDIFVISGALGKIDLEELFRYSERYQKADEQDQGSHPSVHLPNERISLEVEDDRSPHSARVAHCPPAPNSFNTHPAAPSDTKNSVMRPWVNQLLVSDTVRLGDIKKQPRGSRGGERPSDTYNAWVNPRSLLQDGEVSTKLTTICSAHCYHEHKRSHKAILRCTPEQKDGVGIGRMRWL